MLHPKKVHLSVHTFILCNHRWMHTHVVDIICSFVHFTGLPFLGALKQWVAFLIVLSCPDLPTVIGSRACSSLSPEEHMFKLNSGKGNKHFHIKSTHWGLHPSHQLIYTPINHSAGHIKTYNMYIWNGMALDIQCEMQQDWNLTMQTRESKGTASQPDVIQTLNAFMVTPDHWLNGISKFNFYWFRVD